MQEKQHLNNYINKLSQKISQVESQWKGSRFASIDDSDSQGEDQEYDQYQQFMEKYRGKNGDLKPLGLLIYRKFIRNLRWLFFILALMSVPVAIVYSTGKGISDFQKSASFSKSLLLFSIANLPHYRFDNLTNQQLSQVQFHRSLTLCTDIISIFLILGFLLYWKIIAADMSNHYAAKSPSPHLYCLKVTHIQGKTENQIKDHFSKFGKVAQVSAIKTHKNLLIQLNKIIKLVNKHKHTNDISKKELIAQRIYYNYQQIAEAYLKQPSPVIKQCFVCFQEIKTRNKVADLYEYDIMHEKLSFQQITSHTISNAQEGNLCQQKQPNYDEILPYVKKYNFQPLTLNWENFDINKTSQNLKICFQTGLLIVMLFMILIALFLLNINSSHVKQQIIDSNNTLPDSQINQYYNIDQIKNNKKNSQVVYTFCASLTYSTFKWEYYQLCENYYSTQRNRFALMLVFSLLVAVINLLTNRILWALVAFRRYKTLAQRNKFLIKSIFMFSLINSAILILFIRQKHIGPILRQIVGNIFGFSDEVMKVTVYSQFNRQWYMNIGNQLMMNYVVSLIVFPHFHIILHWVRRKYREIMAKKNKKPINDPNFNYCTFYAMALKAIFFAMMYSSCMPVFFLLCFLALSVQLNVGKLLLKKFVKQPVFVDNNAIEVAVEILPFSLLLHCILSIFFTGVDEIFPTADSYFNMELNFNDRNLRRMERGLVYVFISLLIIVFIWNQKRLSKIIVQYWLGRDNKKIQCDLSMKFSELKNNPAFLSSYKMRDNPKYKILYYAMIWFQNHMQAKRMDRKQEVVMNIDSQRTEGTAQNFHNNLYSNEPQEELQSNKDSTVNLNKKSSKTQQPEQDENYIQKQVEPMKSTQNFYRGQLEQKL